MEGPPDSVWEQAVISTRPRKIRQARILFMSSSCTWLRVWASVLSPPHHGRITGSDRSKHQYRKRILPSNPDIAALNPLFGTGNRRLIYTTNEVLLVFLNAPLVAVFRQLRCELVRSSGVFRFESIAWRGPTPPLPATDITGRLAQSCAEQGHSHVGTDSARPIIINNKGNQNAHSE